MNPGEKGGRRQDSRAEWLRDNLNLCRIALLNWEGNYLRTIQGWYQLFFKDGQLVVLAVIISVAHLYSRVRLISGVGELQGEINLMRACLHICKDDY
jgi:hypothetical protein